ncbi:hypothetical protein P4S55_08980 [Shewanella sp. PP-Sp27a-2]
MKTLIKCNHDFLSDFHTLTFLLHGARFIVYARCVLALNCLAILEVGSGIQSQGDDASRMDNSWMNNEELIKDP